MRPEKSPARQFAPNQTSLPALCLFQPQSDTHTNGGGKDQLAIETDLRGLIDNLGIAREGEDNSENSDNAGEVAPENLHPKTAANQKQSAE